MKYITTTEAAARAGLTPRRLRVLLRQGRIPGARLRWDRWQVPEDFTITPGRRGPALRSP